MPERVPPTPAGITEKTAGLLVPLADVTVRLCAPAAVPGAMVKVAVIRVALNTETPLTATPLPPIATVLP